MIVSIALALSNPQEAAAKHRCDEPILAEDQQECAYLKAIEEFTIESIESVAVGSIEEMRDVRLLTRHCNVANRIDHLGAVDLGTYDIINADDNARKCVTQWINQNAPDLEYSEQRFKERFRNAPLLETETIIVKEQPAH